MKNYSKHAQSSINNCKEAEINFWRAINFACETMLDKAYQHTRSTSLKEIKFNSDVKTKLQANKYSCLLQTKGESDCKQNSTPEYSIKVKYYPELNYYLLKAKSVFENKKEIIRLFTGI